VPVNDRASRGDGKWHRKYTADGLGLPPARAAKSPKKSSASCANWEQAQVRVKWWGKSPPHWWQHSVAG
jgi:hypothetical protein